MSATLARLFPAMVLLMLTASHASAQPFTLDPTFGSGGRVFTDVGAGFEAGRDAVLLPDGRIVVCGISQANARFLLVRYRSDGRVDSTFGTNGVVQTSFGSTGGVEATAIARQSDGKLVVAGHYLSSPTWFSAVARYLENGALDPDFGTGGKVTQAIGLVGEVRDVAIQSDGRIVIAGSFRTSGSNTFVGMRRYLDDGTVDSTFGINGTVTRGPGIQHIGRRMALQPDGRIVIAGSVQFSAGAAFQVLAFRFKTDGAPDSSFGGFGRIASDVSAFNDFGQSVALHPDGRILIAGHAGTVPEAANRYLAVRFHADGRRDSTFDADGMALSPLFGAQFGYSFAEDVVFLPTGAALIGGQATLVGTSDDFGLLQFAADGALDPGFDTDGMAILDMANTDRDYISKLLRQPDGKLVAVGQATYPGGAQVAMIRFTGGDATTAAPVPGALRAGAPLACTGANPARGATRLAFTLPRAAHVLLQAYDVAGRALATLADGAFEAGTHAHEWRLDGVPPGLAFVRLTARDATGAESVATTRVVVAR